MDGKFIGKIAISAVIFGLGAFVFQTFHDTPDVASLLLPPMQPTVTAEKFADAVILTGSEVAVQQEGHMARAGFAISNDSNQDVKNIEILCILMDDTGTEQGRDKWVIYDTVKAHSDEVFTYTTKMYVSDLATSSQCQIVDVEEATAPLIAVHRGSAAGHGENHHDTHGDTMHDDAHH
jgi:hypothetical protein